MVRDSSFREEHQIAKIVFQISNVPVVLSADVFIELTVWPPLHIPGHGPWAGIRAWIVYQSFIMQLIPSGTREFLNDMQHIGMRMTCEIEPCPFIEISDIDAKCLSTVFISANGVA